MLKSSKDLRRLVNNVALKTIAERRHLAFAVLSPDLVIRKVTGEFELLVGHVSGSAVGMPLNHVLWEFVGAEQELLAILQDGQGDYILEHVNRDLPDGQIQYLSFQVTRIDRKDPSSGLLLLVEDTSEYGRLYQDLIQDRNELRLLQTNLTRANQELRQLSDLKSLFLSMAAHDLRTPLTSVRGFAEILKSEIPAERADQKEYADIIIAQADRLQRLISDLLDLNQIEQGRLVIERQVCDLDDCVFKVVALLQPTARLRKQELLVTLAEEPLQILADEERITQALYNLVTNAIKYSPEGKQIEIITSRDRDQAVIRVFDQGYGMSEEDMRGLFQIYYRTDKARKSKTKGTGLGLYVVSNIVKAHGGTVTASSQAGQGSTFTVRLPLAEEPSNHAR